MPGKDRTGKRYGKLLAIKQAHKNNLHQYFWECICDCGSKALVFGGNLQSGHTTSCGCEKFTGKANYKHGGARLNQHEKLYDLWKAIKYRCSPNTNNKRNFKAYAGRGIKIQESWEKDYSKFRDYCLKFFPDVNLLLAQGYQIDRIDNDGNYEEGNIRFVSRTKNCRNRRSTIMVVYDGTNQPLIDLAETFAVVKYTTVRARLDNGWCLEDALFRPKGY